MDAPKSKEQSPHRKAYKHLHYLRNKAKYLEAYKKRHNENRALRLKQMRDWYLKNREQCIKKKIERYSVDNQFRANQLANALKHRRNNPEKSQLANYKRRALRRAATINLAGLTAYVASVRRSKIVTCYYCCCKLSGKTAHMDHIIPLSRGGEHSARNLCVSCPKCNLSKKARSPQAWIRIGQQFLSL